MIFNEEKMLEICERLGIEVVEGNGCYLNGKPLTIDDIKDMIKFDNDVNYYVRIYIEALDNVSEGQLSRHMCYLRDELWNKRSDLRVLDYVCEKEDDENKIKLRKEINDIKNQIKAIKIVLGGNDE